METDFFTQQADTLKHRIDAMFNKLRDPSIQNPELFQESIVNLVSAMEELRVAEEEISNQVEELRSVQERAEAERQRYQSLFQFSPDSYLITTVEGAILEANEAATKMFSNPLRGLIRKPLVLYVANEDRHAFRRRINLALYLQEQQQFEVRLLGPGKEPFQASVTVAPLINACGKVDALRWLVRDITRVKNLESALLENKARFRLVWQYSNLGVVILNKKNALIESSPIIHRMLGYSEHEFNTLSLSNFVHIDDLENISSCLQQITTGDESRSRFEGRLIRKDSQVVYVRILFVNYKSSKSDDSMVIAFVDDISEKVALQKEVSELKRRLAEMDQAQVGNLDGDRETTKSAHLKQFSPTLDGANQNGNKSDGHVANDVPSAPALPESNELVMPNGMISETGQVEE